MKNYIKQNPILRIAVKHLFSKKKQTFAAILGVTFGIAACIFQAGIITGIQTFFIQRTIDFSAHIRIYNDGKKERQSIIARQYLHSLPLAQQTAEKPKFSEAKLLFAVRNQKNAEESPRLRNGYQIMELIEKDEQVLGVSPFLGSQVLIRAGVTQTGARIAGIDVDRENFIFNVQKYMTAGNINDLKLINNGVVLGAGLANSLGVKMGDYVLIASNKGTTLEMKIIGINRTGVIAVDDARAYITLANAQKLLNVDGAYITDINIKIKDITQAAKVAQLYQRRFAYKADDWIKANEGVFAIFNAQNAAIYIVIVSMMLVAGFGIFNILTMIIYEKMPDIAILKAIGYDNKAIRAIFLTEALCIGFIGGVLGLILGYAVSVAASHYKVNIDRGLLALDYLPINFNISFYLLAFGFGLLITALAGYFPAKKASEVDPITIIRGK
jgi:lipoprotein-releasing system permease protein